VEPCYNPIIINVDCEPYREDFYEYHHRKIMGYLDDIAASNKKMNDDLDQSIQRRMVQQQLEEQTRLLREIAEKE